MSSLLLTIFLFLAFVQHIGQSFLYASYMGRIRKRLAGKIRKLRGKSTLRDFARKLGIAKSTLHRIEMEENVGLDTLEQICKRLKCDITDLFPPER